MNLLIVDDDPIAVKVIEKKLAWDNYGVEGIYKAYSKQQATEVFESHQVDLMICDIEMPKESGLELTEWVRRQGLKTAVIYLTSHDKFSYAKEAITQGVVGYLLKPADKEELDHYVRKACKEIRLQHSRERLKWESQHWQHSQNIRESYFWERLLSYKKELSREELSTELLQLGVEVSVDSRYFPVLIRYTLASLEEEANEDALVEYSLKRMIGTYFFKRSPQKYIITLEKGYIIALIGVEEEADAMILEKCKLFIKGCGQLEACGYQVICYSGGTCRLDGLQNQVKKLLMSSYNDVQCISRVVDLMTLPIQSTTYQKPAIDTWLQQLQRGHRQEAEQLLDDFMDTLQQENYVTRTVLRRFQQDFLQSTYALLEANKIDAQMILFEEEGEARFLASDTSVEAMRQWVKYLYERIQYYCNYSVYESKAIGTIKKYIEEHIEENIPRADLAALVYLNEDYLSRIFKDKMGLTLSDYMIGERIRLAKELLKNSEESIRDIAFKVGYDNISYFSRLFKRSTGDTPSEYRKKYQL